MAEPSSPTEYVDPIRCLLLSSNPLERHVCDIHTPPNSHVASLPSITSERPHNLHILHVRELTPSIKAARMCENGSGWMMVGMKRCYECFQCQISSTDVIGGLNLVLGGLRNFPQSARRDLTVRTNNHYALRKQRSQLGLHDGMSRVFLYPAVNLEPFHSSCAI